MYTGRDIHPRPDRDQDSRRDASAPSHDSYADPRPDHHDPKRKRSYAQDHDDSYHSKRLHRDNGYHSTSYHSRDHYDARDNQPPYDSRHGDHDQLTPRYHRHDSYAHTPRSGAYHRTEDDRGYHRTEDDRGTDRDRRDGGAWSARGASGAWDDRYDGRDGYGGRRDDYRRSRDDYHPRPAGRYDRPRDDRDRRDAYPSRQTADHDRTYGGPTYARRSSYGGQESAYSGGGGDGHRGGRQGGWRGGGGGYGQGWSGGHADAVQELPDTSHLDIENNLLPDGNIDVEKVFPFGFAILPPQVWEGVPLLNEGEEKEDGEPKNRGEMHQQKEEMSDCEDEIPERSVQILKPRGEMHQQGQELLERREEELLEQCEEHSERGDSPRQWNSFDGTK